MREPLFDPAAAKRTVSLTINADLCAKAKAAGLKLSKIAEAAIAEALIRAQRAELQAEIDQDLRAYNAYVAEHGSFADHLREHLDEGEARASA